MVSVAIAERPLGLFSLSAGVAQLTSPNPVIDELMARCVAERGPTALPWGAVGTRAA